jgi:fumarate hydratase subunit beta
VSQRTITPPLTDDIIAGLKSGDSLLVTGTLFVARDRAHQRLCSMLESGQPLPFDASGQIIYYMGPSPAPPGRIIGSAGPTTSGRMDPFTGQMLSAGVRGFIGKGKRDTALLPLFRQYRAVYFSTYGGAGALLGTLITGAETVAFEDLGPEALLKIEVRDFPVVVINDIHGGDLYEDAIRQR